MWPGVPSTSWGREADHLHLVATPICSYPRRVTRGTIADDRIALVHESLATRNNRNDSERFRENITLARSGSLDNAVSVGAMLGSRGNPDVETSRPSCQ
jgi:hypothetical protein